MAYEEPRRSLLWPAVLVGIGVAGSLDEIVLHQLLRWHHFYDRGSQAAALIADGQHKLLGLHQVRAGAPNNLPTIWCLSAWPPWCCWPGCSCSGWPVRRAPRRVGTVRNSGSG